MGHEARVRCAIYTRKSSEEGLSQSFNSLHAQREYCEAYIKSQGGEGWTIGAVSLTLKVLHFEGCKPLVEKAFYETAIV